MDAPLCGFVNMGCLVDVLDVWRAQGCMGEIERRLGYRFRLAESQTPASLAAGEEFKLTLKLADDGFGNLYIKRSVEIVLRRKDGGEAIRLATGEDPRLWMTGCETEVRLAGRIPETAAAGEYEVLLSLPDLAESIRGRPEYAIRLANEGVWEEAAGMNLMAHTLTVER